MENLSFRECNTQFDAVLFLFWAVLSEDMVKDGYEDVVNIDISSVVIEQMREKHMDIPQLTCTVCVNNSIFFFCFGVMLSICDIFTFFMLCFKTCRWMSGI